MKFLKIVCLVSFLLLVLSCAVPNTSFKTQVSNNWKTKQVVTRSASTEIDLIYHQSSDTCWLLARGGTGVALTQAPNPICKAEFGS